MTRNVMNTPEMSNAGRTWPVGTNARTDNAKNSPSVTKLTDMNEYRNASNLDQPFTSPVALRRNRDGVSPIVATVTPSRDVADPALAVDQLVRLHLSFLLVDCDQRRLQHALLVGTPWIEYERRAEPGRALRLVDVPVE